MSYLRFRPDEYEAISRVCGRLGTAGDTPLAFRRLLVEGLNCVCPSTAAKIARIRGARLMLLHEHFRGRPQKAAEAGDATQAFTTSEWRTLAEACVSTRFPVRLVRPFRGLLIEMFREAWPELARKVANLSGEQFEQIYRRACERGRGKG